MEAKKNVGLVVSENDGYPLSSGNHRYWDPQFSQIVEQYIGDFLPEVRLVAKSCGSARFTAIFSRQMNGHDVCWRSKSFANPKIRISELEVSELIDKINALHSKISSPDISPDTKTWIRNFTLPHPGVMKRSWRYVKGARKLAILWGYASDSPEAQILPLTETSSLWPDAESRVDLRKLLLEENRIGNTGWNWGQQLFSGFLIVGIILLFLLCVRSCICERMDGPKVRLDDPGKNHVVKPQEQNKDHAENVDSKADDVEGPEKYLPNTPLRSAGVESPGKENPHAHPSSPTAPLPLECDIHNRVQLENGKCPRVCKECGRHLNTRNQCENICPTHIDTHLENGHCPKCNEKPMTKIDARVILLKEEAHNGMFNLMFGINSPDERIEHLQWQWIANIDDGREAHFCGSEFVSSAAEKCTVIASAAFARDGREVHVKALPYTWTKELPPVESVERNLAQYGGCRIDQKTKSEYFTIKLFSQPEDNRASVSGWEAEIDGATIPVYDGQEPNTMWLYKTDIKKDGRVKITAHVDIKGKSSRNISKVFVYKADILSAEGEIDERIMPIATTLKVLLGGSVFACFTPDGLGTAFAITERDFITNEHVVGEYQDVMLFSSGTSYPEDGIRASVMATNKRHDLAWIRTGRPLGIRPFLVDWSCAGTHSSKVVVAMGYPHWQFDENVKKTKTIPELLVSAGTIEGKNSDAIYHYAPITHGSSGGPLINLDGVVVGVNAGGNFNQKNGEIEETIMRSIPAARIQECFGELIRETQRPTP